MTCTSTYLYHLNTQNVPDSNRAIQKASAVLIYLVRQYLCQKADILLLFARLEEPNKHLFNEYLNVAIG